VRLRAYAGQFLLARAGYVSARVGDCWTSRTPGSKRICTESMTLIVLFCQIGLLRYSAPNSRVASSSIRQFGIGFQRILAGRSEPFTGAHEPSACLPTPGVDVGLVVSHARDVECPARLGGLKCFVHPVELVDIVEQGRDTDHLAGGSAGVQTAMGLAFPGLRQLCASMLVTLTGYLLLPQAADRSCDDRERRVWTEVGIRLRSQYTII
jgi:hypothetical protein